MTSKRFDGRRSALPALWLASTSIAFAIASPAQAQSAFQGSVTRAQGASVTQAAGHDIIAVGRSTAVIDWKPSDTATGGGAIDFLPAGSTASFVGTVAGDYTVLNRINAVDSSRAIAFNGTVESLARSGATQVRGGSIWFYAPGGLLLGSTATFNVGSLLLTANAVTTTTGTGGETFDPTKVAFTAAAGSKAAITVEPGAAVNAVQTIALIAPRIVQAGAIRADGQIAYIAAEKGTLTMPQAGGLFSIQVDTGSSAGDVTINHSGSTGRLTTRRGAPNLPVNHVVYAVTVAKNSAVSMLLGGTIEDPANVALKVGDAVVLSAGYDVVNGKVASLINNIAPSVSPAGAPTSIRITNAVFGTQLNGVATGGINLLASNGALTLARGASFLGGGSVSARATTGGTISGTSLNLQSHSLNGLIGGAAGVTADGGGAISLSDTLTVDTSAGRGNFFSVPAGTSPDATGGTSAVKADGGTITTGDLRIFADATPASVELSSSFGNATGGVANLLVRGGGAVTAKTATLRAVADSSSEGGDIDVTGLGAIGGHAGVQVYDGTLTVGTSSPTVFGFGDLSIDASGFAGAGAEGSDGRGGTASLVVAGGALTIGDSVSVRASGLGGKHNFSQLPGEGIGYGGTATVNFIAGSDGTQPTVSMKALNVYSGGDTAGGFSDEFSTAPIGGDAFGGTSSIAIGAGTITIPRITASASGTGGRAAASGDGYGGRATILMTGGNTTSYSVAALAVGTGGLSEFGNAGAGHGGTAQLLLNGGNLTLTNAPAELGWVSGLTGAAVFNAGATGGTVQGAGTQSIIGAGFGGTAKLASYGTGTHYSANSTLVSALGTGGSGTTSTRGYTRGGAGTGGTATLAAYGGTLDTGLTQVTARGIGTTAGSGAKTSLGGAGTGGTASVVATTAGAVHARTLLVDGGAEGGKTTSTTLTGVGGAAVGGKASVNASGGTVQVDGPIFRLIADGVGGDGLQRGGDGTAGTVALTATNGGSIASGVPVELRAPGYGGTGTVRGKGKGGTATVQSSGGGTLPAAITTDTSTTP